MVFSEFPYERVNVEQLQAEAAQICEQFSQAKSVEEQFAIHQTFMKKMDHVRTMMEIAMIRHTGDVSDEFYKAEQDFYDEVQPLLQAVSVKFNTLMYESPFRAQLEETIGPVAFRSIELAMKSFDESIIPLMQKENALVSEYENLLAKALVDMDGKEVNLSGLGPYLTSDDRDVRRRAALKRSGFLQEHQEELDRLYDELVKNRDAQAKALGFERYTELGYARMNRNSYERKDVEAFRDQVKRDWVPLCEALHEKRRQRLGVDHLYYYDEPLYFASGNPKPQGTPQEILENGRQMYRELSPETKEFFDFMMDGELFDVLGRKNKRTGGYMTYIPDHKAPFIFANFNGTSGDVDVITHECGHAFQGYITRDIEISEQRDITMETAETHSMSMEFFTEPWMDRFFGDRAKDYVEMHLEDAICFIPYGCMVDEFQHIVYDNPSMTPVERRQAWQELERVYRPHMDFTGDAYMEAGGFWQKQHHIYSYPLYYIDYCLAQVNALQFKAWMEEDYPTAWKAYLQFCRLPIKHSFVEMITGCGLQSPFADGSLKALADKMIKKA